MRIVFAAGMALMMLAGCATEPSIYQESSFDKLSWAKKSFAEIEARCTDDSLRHDRSWGDYQVVRPLYKSCMHHYGYAYHGSSEIRGNDVVSPFTEPKTTAEKTENISAARPATPAADCADNSSGVDDDKAALYR